MGAICKAYEIKGQQMQFIIYGLNCHWMNSRDLAVRFKGYEFRDLEIISLVGDNYNPIIIGMEVGR